MRRRAPQRFLHVARLVSAGLLLFCWASACCGDISGSPSWSLNALPESLRALVHLSSAEVPPYPPQDPVLLKPLQWPDSMAFLGRQYHLEVGAQAGDQLTFGSKRVIQPGWAVDLGYSYQYGRQNNGVPLFHFAGPDYSWNQYGRLCRRTWIEPDTVTYHSASYTTYPSGALFLYELAIRKADIRVARDLATLTECFGRDGFLLGFSYSGNSEPDRYWWQGQPVSEVEWKAKLKPLVLEINDEDRRRGK